MFSPPEKYFGDAVSDLLFEKKKKCFSFPGHFAAGDFSTEQIHSPFMLLFSHSFLINLLSFGAMAGDRKFKTVHYLFNINTTRRGGSAHTLSPAGCFIALSTTGQTNQSFGKSVESPGGLY